MITINIYKINLKLLYQRIENLQGKEIEIER